MKPITLTLCGWGPFRDSQTVDFTKLSENGIFLITGQTGAGKTTMLRDIVRQLSYKSYRVSVVDERSEIAALCDGRSAFDLGFSTDVLEGVDKAEGLCGG